MRNSFRSIRTPQRWDEPFGPDMTDADVDWLLKKDPFSEIDPANFSETTPFRGILKNDTRITRYKRGEIVIRKGDYDNFAFLILEGSVRVFLDDLDEEILGRQKPEKKYILRSFRQLWSNSPIAEFRDVSSFQNSSGTRLRREGKDIHVFLQNYPSVIHRYSTDRLEEGSMFGEIAALGRTPQPATVIADEGCVLCEIRWQGLHEIRRRDEGIRHYVDRLYRERSLKEHLRNTPDFSHLDEKDIQFISENTLFETYGDFDWHTSYTAFSRMDPAERLEYEPIIAEEGSYADGLIIIRAGFAHLLEKVDHGYRTISYLGRGATFGFNEICHNYRFDEKVPFQQTLRAMGYVDVLRVPTSIVEQYVVSSMPEKKLPPRIRTGQPSQSIWKKVNSERKLEAGLWEFLVDNRFINGTSTMLIDLNRCTRCDDCVTACAGAHDGNPRFIRSGKRFGKFLVANACMHCIDPVCMIGCPTGAIHRSSYEGQVVINDNTCIGCSTCANSCPYDNIQMVQIREKHGAFVIDQATNASIEKATKCDLCIDQIGGPACLGACPHDALARIDVRDEDALLKWTQR